MATEQLDPVYAPVILRNLRIVLASLASSLSAVSGTSTRRLAAGSLGSRAADALFTIVVALLLASALWGVVKTAVDRHVPHEIIDAHAAADGEGSHSGLSRLQTLLPVVRKFLFATIVVIVGMTVVSGTRRRHRPAAGRCRRHRHRHRFRRPGAGTRYCLRHLLLDRRRLPHWRIHRRRAAKGTVERISIRSLRLRHHLGQINTIPFGEIKTVTNYSRDWVIMKLELRVPLDTDIEKVRKLVKRVGQDMQQNPELARPSPAAAKIAGSPPDGA